MYTRHNFLPYYGWYVKQLARLRKKRSLPSTEVITCWLMSIGGPSSVAVQVSSWMALPVAGGGNRMGTGACKRGYPSGMMPRAIFNLAIYVVCGRTFAKSTGTPPVVRIFCSCKLYPNTPTHPPTHPPMGCRTSRSRPKPAGTWTVIPEATEERAEKQTGEKTRPKPVIHSLRTQRLYQYVVDRLERGTGQSMRAGGWTGLIPPTPHGNSIQRLPANTTSAATYLSSVRPTQALGTRTKAKRVSTNGPNT